MYCPEWIFGCSAALTAKGFLSSENSLNALARKYATGLSEKYSPIKFEEVSETAEGILQFLAEIEVGDEAVEYIDNYVYKRIKYLNNGAERKLSGMFNSAFNPEKEKDYSVENSIKVFRATIYGIRNNTMPKAPPGWNVLEEEELDWYKELIEKPIDILDNF